MHKLPSISSISSTVVLEMIWGKVIDLFLCLCFRFELVGGRMLVFSRQQAEHYLRLCDAGSFDLVPTLTSGPSLVLALQRDNALMAFNTLLGG